MILTAPKYRHFVPQAPELVYEMPVRKPDDTRTLSFQYSLSVDESFRQEGNIFSHWLPEAVWGIPEQYFSIYINGVLQKPYMSVYNKIENEDGSIKYAGPWGLRGYYKSETFLHIYATYLDTILVPGTLEWQDIYEYPPKPGSVVYVKAVDRVDGWFHLDIRHLLIQGANPLDNSILTKLDNFQGGYRIEYEAIDSVKYGQLRRCDSQLGWDYRPPSDFKGIDSFSYRLVTAFGQYSEPACCSIRVGF